MLIHTVLDTDIVRINAALTAERMGHVLDGWQDDQCRCLKCLQYVQVRDGIQSGQALDKQCPFKGDIFTALRIRDAREEVNKCRMSLDGLAGIRFGHRSTPEDIAAYNAGLEQYGKLYSVWDHATHAGEE